MRAAGARPILHATDFSAASRPAFQKAIELARPTRSRLLLVHVLNPLLPAIADEDISPPTYERFQEASRRWARAQLQKLVARAKTARVPATPILLEGAEAQAIARAARARRASMIVMGTHGRSGITRVVLGSVAARVLSLAPCPVLTVRGK
jgi:nucleotide-binding universal stress UspA family protein